MAVALSWPTAQVVDCKGTKRFIKHARHLVAADQAEHFDVDNLRCRLIRLCRQALANRFGERGIGDHLKQDTRRRQQSRRPSPPKLVKRFERVAPAAGAGPTASAVEPLIDRRPRSKSLDLLAK
jgi:hypothetical protein